MSKAIFLDVDGVLNNSESISLLHDILGRQQYLLLLNGLGETPFDDRRCGGIRTLIEKTGAEVILSSTWRRSKKGIELVEKYAGIKVKDITPYLGTSRGYEIQSYLDKHKEITNYVIIDDDSDMLDSQRDNFVKVNSRFGFCYEDYVKAAKVLSKE